MRAHSALKARPENLDLGPHDMEVEMAPQLDATANGKSLGLACPRSLPSTRYGSVSTHTPAASGRFSLPLARATPDVAPISKLTKKHFAFLLEV